MYSEISIWLLQVHPKNSDYFAELPSEKYEEIKQSITTHGIRDPLKVLSDYTIVAGHQRLRIAKELGFEKVPVIVLDIAPEEAEYLLIADNEERRQGDDNPMRKARRAEFLKQYWSIREGRPSKLDKKYPVKTLDDVAEVIGEERSNLKKLLKLNDLIPSLQALVSTGSLTQTAAYSLAFLPQDEQQELLNTLGDSGVCGLSGKDAQSLREELSNIQKEKESLTSRLTELQEERTMLADQLSDLQDAFSAVEEEAAEDHSSHYEELRHEVLLEFQEQLDAKVTEVELLRAKLQSLTDSSVEKTIEKIVYKPDPAFEIELEAARQQAAKLLEEKEWLTDRFQVTVQEKEQKEAKLRTSEEKSAELERRLDHFKKELADLRSRPRPKLDQQRVNFHALVESICGTALALTNSLKSLEEEYSEDLIAAARVRGGHDVEEIATTMLDAASYKMLDLTLDAAIERISCIFTLLQPAKPNLRIVPKQSPDQK